MALARPGHAAFIGGVLLALLAGALLELTRPTLLLVGNVTVDIVEGKQALGGAVSYAAAVASALGVRACVVTANNEDADLSLFKEHDLHVVPSDDTLTFVHTYTFWGNKRKLKVTRQPNVTLTWEHVPRHCRRARVVLLGPLMPEDMDPASFVRRANSLWDRLLGVRQRVGLMAQGLQRALDTGGAVKQLRQPSQQLEASLGPSTSLFLSDVEADVWVAGEVERLAASSEVFLVTRGSDGADEYTSGLRTRHPVFQIGQVVDTNGAGDSFATGYILAAAAGHSNPAAVANWAGAMAVSQPQSCKPGCVGTAAKAHRATMPPSSTPRGVAAVAAATLWEPVQQFVGPKVAALLELLSGRRAAK